MLERCVDGDRRPGRRALDGDVGVRKGHEDKGEKAGMGWAS